MTTRHAASTHRPAPAHRLTPTPAALRTVLVHALTLLPSAVAEVALLARGDRHGVRRRAGLPVGDPPTSAAVLQHALLTAVLGAGAWFLAGLALLGAARGPFYGFVDPGPYDRAWGGPGLVGAWAVHALVWLAVLPVWALLTWAISALQRAVTRRLLDGAGPRWALPVTLVVLAGLAVFVRAWVHQL